MSDTLYFIIRILKSGLVLIRNQYLAHLGSPYSIAVALKLQYTQQLHNFCSYKSDDITVNNRACYCYILLAVMQLYLISIWYMYTCPEELESEEL